MKRLLVLAAATITLAACAETTAPSAATTSATDRASRDLTCKSGYIIAYRSDGTAYCEQVQQGTTSGLSAPTGAP